MEVLDPLTGDVDDIARIGRYRDSKTGMNISTGASPDKGWSLPYTPY